MADDEDDATLVPVAKRIGELLGQIAEQLNKRQPVEATKEQAAELLAQLEEQSAVAADEPAITLYRPIQSQLRLIAEQLAPLGEAANRLVEVKRVKARLQQRLCLNLPIAACSLTQPATHQHGRDLRVALQRLGECRYPLQQVRIAFKVCDFHLRQAGLAGAEHFARAADFQVFLGNAEAVGGFAHDGKTLARAFRQRRMIEQHAEAFGAAPTHPATQLVKLRKP